MKKTLLLLILFVGTIGNAQRFDWVKFTSSVSGSSNGSAGAFSIAKDDEDFIYTISGFVDNLNIGNDTIVHVGTLYGQNLAIVKWNTDGEIVNTKQLSAGHFGLTPFKIAYDEENEQILISAAVSQMPVEIVNDTTYSEPSHLVQLIRFTKDLEYVSHANLSNTYHSSMVSKDGATYIANNYQSIVRKIDADNITEWDVTTTQGAYSITDIILGTDDTIYVIGCMAVSGSNTAVIFGGIPLNVPAGAVNKIGIFKMTTSGTVLEGFLLCQTTNVYANMKLAADAEGNVYVAAPYGIGGQTIGDHTLSSPVGANDAFVAKLSPDLEPQWVTELHNSTANMETNALLIGASGQLMLTGLYGSNATFGDFTLTTNSYGTGYLAQLDTATGEILYATNYGALSGTGRPRAMLNIGDAYYLTGLSYSQSENGGSFGCYRETKSGQFLTRFTDTPYSQPTLYVEYSNGTLTSDATAEAQTYQWYLGAVLIEGATEATYTPTQTGNYTLVAEFEYGCSDTATFEVTTLGSGEASENDFTIYPNPSNGKIHLSNPQHQTITQISIFDQLGKRVLSKNDDLSQIDISNLSNGMYIIQISANEKTVHQKIIKI